MDPATKIKEFNDVPVDIILEHWPKETPLIVLGGSGRYTMIALDFYEVSFASFVSLTLKEFKAPPTHLPFASGYMCLISFEEYTQLQRISPSKNHSRAFRINSSLVFDHLKKKLYVSTRNKPCNHPIQKISASYQLSDFVNKLLSSNHKSSHEGSTHNAHGDRIKLEARVSDKTYIDQCKKAIADIRSGRYYQINLLRYFKIPQKLTAEFLAKKMLSQSGPYGAFLHLHDSLIASFSPEKFIEIKRSEESFSIHTYPIKGTLPRRKDPKTLNEDQLSLLNSQKDRRELNIIIDLMRNDLNRVSKTGSVRVNDKGSVHTFNEVHHLIASLSSELQDNLSLNDLFQNLCPGGSITGAPKKEVLQAIQEFEKRDRSYFMGNICYMDDSGHLDSSILIRTLLGQKHTKQDFECEYAAGSGIVIGSQPQQELEEINAKCAVITGAATDIEDS